MRPEVVCDPALGHMPCVLGLQEELPGQERERVVAYVGVAVDNESTDTHTNTKPPPESQPRATTSPATTTPDTPATEPSTPPEPPKPSPDTSTPEDPPHDTTANSDTTTQPKPGLHMICLQANRVLETTVYHTNHTTPNRATKRRACIGGRCGLTRRRGCYWPVVQYCWARSMAACLVISASWSSLRPTRFLSR